MHVFWWILALFNVILHSSLLTVYIMESNAIGSAVSTAIILLMVAIVLDEATNE